jgi:hypothetical protein
MAQSTTRGSHTRATEEIALRLRGGKNCCVAVPEQQSTPCTTACGVNKIGAADQDPSLDEDDGRRACVTCGRDPTGAYEKETLRRP